MQPQPTALITGASGGIGYALSKLFAADGYTLILVARSTDKLNQLAADLTKGHGVTIITLPKDLSFEMTAGELGMRGRWEVRDPCLTLPDAATEYSVTWREQPRA
jgi:short-subunit dehydrogenase